MPSRDAISLVQVSDIHLDPRREDDRARCELIRRAVRSLEPDLVVFSGDVSRDACLEPDTLRGVLDLLRDFGPRTAFVPGNHDVGNQVGSKRDIVCDEWIQHWRSTLGDDKFSLTLGGWTFVGIDTQVLTLPQGQEQFDFLERELHAAPQAAVFGHMPLFLREPSEHVSDKSAYWVPPVTLRDRILLLLQTRASLYASGHVHWYARFHPGGTEYLWAPPAYPMIVDDDKFPRSILPQTPGIVHYQFAQSTFSAQVIPLDFPAHVLPIDRADI